MRKIGSIFKVWETDFVSLRGHFWPLEAKSALWEASSRVWGPRSETRTLILTSGRPKSVVPRQISPMGERILTSGRSKPGWFGQFWVWKAQKGQFLGSQPGKGSRVLAPNGDRFSILGPRRIRKSWRSPKCVPNLTQMWVWKTSFFTIPVEKSVLSCLLFVYSGVGSPS